MQKNKVYLDYAATSPLSKSVIKNIREMAEMFYNSSSLYSYASYNKSVVENVRKRIAEFINAEPEEIFFTSGGSESNTLAINGFDDKYPVVCTNIEHSSVLNNKKIISTIKCDESGFFNLNSFRRYENTLICVMMANNEIGSIQPIKEISDLVHKKGNYLFVDAVQAFGKIPIDVKEMNIDMLSASGHKIGGIKGAGFLYVKKGIALSPIIYGNQENKLRGGTYNELAIKSFGLALDDIDFKNSILITAKRDYLLKELLALNNIHINGTTYQRLCNNINIRIDDINIDSHQIVTLMDSLGFMISSGSACHENSNVPSYVLKAIGLTDEQANKSIRITIGIDTSVDDLDRFVKALKYIINNANSN